MEGERRERKAKGGRSCIRSGNNYSSEWDGAVKIIGSVGLISVITRLLWRFIATTGALGG